MHSFLHYWRRVVAASEISRSRLVHCSVKQRSASKRPDCKPVRSAESIGNKDMSDTRQMQGRGMPPDISESTPTCRNWQADPSTGISRGATLYGCGESGVALKGQRTTPTQS